MSKFWILSRAIIIQSFNHFRIFKAFKFYNHHNIRILKIQPIQFFSVALLSWLVKSNSPHFPFQSKEETEKDISDKIKEAEDLIRNGQRREAKNVLTTAIKMADDYQTYDNFAYLCDLLATIVLSENDFIEAENILVNFIEKFLQLGFPETHNNIVRFKLKLARIYQLLGSAEMAEYGFRDCIRVQEQKLVDQKQLDEESNAIYMTALFWYGKLLTDQGEFAKARKQFKLCWDRTQKTNSVLPSQKMVVLHSIAQTSAFLKDYDAALKYLYSAIEICLMDDPNNIDLPILVVEVGLVFLQKEIYESASLWCKTGYDLAAAEGNDLAKKEGQLCLNQLRKLRVL